MSKYALRAVWVADGVIRLVFKEYILEQDDGGVSVPLEPFPADLHAISSWDEFKHESAAIEAGEIESLLEEDALQISLIDDWQPWRERRRDAEQRLRTIFEVVLYRRMNEIECLAVQSGLERSPTVGEVVGKKRSVKKIDEHCEWLAMYQCAGLTFAEIADQFPATKDVGSPRAIQRLNRPNTIQKAVKALAEKIDLPLRS